jgi:aquaporin Z
MPKGAAMNGKRLLAEAVGTGLLVFFAVGVATLSFGFGFGTNIPSAGPAAAGIIATALAFGLVLMGLAYSIGPVSGAHVNPAVTLGFVASGRMAISEAIGYWIAQFFGGFVGALLLWAVFQGSSHYDRETTGLGVNGYGSHSPINLNAGGAFVAEVILTAMFVFVVLSASTKYAHPAVAGLVIGLALTLVHLIGIPLTGTSVNPARSLGPALVVHHNGALKQIWVFIVAPLVGGLLAAGLWRTFDTGDTQAAAEAAT